MSNEADARCQKLEAELVSARETIAQLESEYAEFEKGSKELEEHLEGENSRLEDELEVANKRLKAMKVEVQDAKEKQIDTERSMQTTIQSLEQELEQERTKTSKLNARLVALEQENEDLQRMHRELQADFGKSQSTADNALEAHAVVQTDLEDLQELSKETIQRLTDELRELMEENAQLQRKVHQNASIVAHSDPSIESAPSEPKQTTPLSTPIKLAADPSTPRTPMTGTPMERRRDLLETLNTIAGIAKALETKLKPQS
jgi:chromosome segregation ATPase